METGKSSTEETIDDTVFGYGHFEPLRHYAEVHLMLEPGKRGSGMTYSSKVPRDVLSLNWQRLVLSSLSDHVQKGILTGSALTDIHVTLIAGRAHQKHTQGGDFRQAASRAMRRGLKRRRSSCWNRFSVLKSQRLPKIFPAFCTNSKPDAPKFR